MRETFAKTLLDRGLITADQLHIATLERKKRNASLSEILVDLRFIDERTLGKALSERSGYAYVDIGAKFISRELVEKFGLSACAENGFIPLAVDDKLRVAMADPENIVIRDLIKKWARKIFTSDLECAFYYGGARAIKNALSEAMAPNAEEPDAPFEKLFASLFRNAALERASDIHFVPHERMVEIRIRRDGDLEVRTRLEPPVYAKFAVRLKLLAKLDIAETRLPQSGGCAFAISDLEIECRLSFHPTLWGESLTVRLLTANAEAPRLDELGFDENRTASLRQILKAPFGLFLISGATGSGKTTTLHALLRELDATTLNVMTLEQPIEYRVPGVRQTEIKEASGMTFAEGIRSILRHDPDVLLIGEIRDEDTAKMALRAAMTGHLVLATVHSSNAYTAPARLIDLGVSPRLLAGQIIGALEQTLVKTATGEKRVAKGELVIFNDDMHRVVGEGGNPPELKKAHRENSGFFQPQ